MNIRAWFLLFVMWLVYAGIAFFCVDRAAAAMALYAATAIPFFTFIFWLCPRLITWIEKGDR